MSHRALRLRSGQAEVEMLKTGLSRDAYMSKLNFRCIVSIKTLSLTAFLSHRALRLRSGEA